MLYLLHFLCPKLHQHKKTMVALPVRLQGAIGIMPCSQAKCVCGDVRPLGSVELVKEEA